MPSLVLRLVTPLFSRTIRFTPSSEGIQECEVEVEDGCGVATLFGRGGSIDQNEPVVALHVQPLLDAPEGGCDPDEPQEPCSDFETRGGLGASMIYLVIGKAKPAAG